MKYKITQKKEGLQNCIISKKIKEKVQLIKIFIDIELSYTM